MIYIAVSTGRALSHYGILGQKWGVRRYQNEDGTLTEAGKKRYLNSDGSYNERYARDRKRNRLGASPEERSAERANKAVTYFIKNYDHSKTTSVIKKNIQYSQDRVRNAKNPNEKKAWQLMVEYDKRMLQRYNDLNQVLSNKSAYTKQEIFEKLDQFNSERNRDREETLHRTSKIWPHEQIFD